ncbi:MAG: helix-turn-helix domain-containing protein [Rhizobiaceae bacterium]|nr:helix-turn-helix domain-containing protein [Rhizobiaceae bacterium]
MDTEAQPTNVIDHAIGTTLSGLRKSRGMTARQLAANSEVSAAMISRIESGQVSPSISTLNALSSALDVPLISLFRETASAHADFTHVKQGEGLKSTRMIDEHSHDFINLAFHTRRDMQFEARMVTLVRQSAKPPRYVGHGVVFVYAIEGEAVYQYGKQEITLNAGDSLSLDAELSHGFVEIVTPEFVFLTVQAERR